jgi:hypothetical protein
VITQFPYWSVKGFVFYSYNDALLFASQKAIETKQSIVIMEKLDQWTASYVLETVY